MTEQNTAESSYFPEAKLSGIEEDHSSSLWRDAWFRLAKNKLAIVAVVYLVLLILFALFAPWLTPYLYEETDLMLGAVAPSWLHWFGTDDLGRDLATRVLFGARVSLLVGFLATTVSVLIGVIYGAVAGYVGGRLDSFMMRCVDVLYSLPFAILVILIMVFFGRSIYNLFLALGAIQWLVMARIVRGQVYSIKHTEFIMAAEAMGLNRSKILFRHIIPNTFGPVIVFATLTIPAVILEEAFLSFLGLGIQPPMPSWGTLINDGVNQLELYPWIVLFPCGILMITLLALNFLGDGLRDALDPKASRD